MYLIWIFIRQKRKREENTDLEGISVFSPGSASCNKRGGCCAAGLTVPLPADCTGTKPIQDLFMVHSTELTTFHWNGYYFLEGEKQQHTKDKRFPAPCSFSLDSSRSVWNGSNCWIWEPKLPKASVWHRAVGKGVQWKEEKPTCYILGREKAQLAPCGLKQTHPIISVAGASNCPSGFSAPLQVFPVLIHNSASSKNISGCETSNGLILMMCPELSNFGELWHLSHYAVDSWGLGFYRSF